MNNTLNDQKDRERALDPTMSFIVQAPAGSGKTELLTQRFLVLLNQVKLPEEILAITFTKKSAHEMRARIINTLKKAEQSPAPPEQAHALKTWKLAQNVLQRDKTLQWNLLANPNRLRIQTIDSFNSSLTRHLPILSQFGAAPEIADEPKLLYTEAVQELLSYLKEDVDWSNAIAQLLLHMDNDLNRVQTLLINMLAKRDQWLQHVTTGKNDIELREELELSLQHTITDTLSQLVNIFNSEKLSYPRRSCHPEACFSPKDLLVEAQQLAGDPSAKSTPQDDKLRCGGNSTNNELLELLKFSATNLLAEHSNSLITACVDLSELPGENLEDKDLWLGIAEFLLTKDNQWRKTFTVKEGFPAAGKNPLLKEFKERAIHLVNQLSQHENLRATLEELRSLPADKYLDSQWEILKALHTVLKIAVAQLKLTFQKYGKIDYIENAQAALLALGSEDAPTDIALALDYRIQHILVDEFQDTANMQYLLLEKLTAGWEPNDGRTLFVVGDPMQSIYRFREAEVGLFIRARKHGLKRIALVPLTLSVNFRSTTAIVEWVNHHFKTVFPAYEDIATGAVSYSSSVANASEQVSLQNSVQLHSFINDHAQQAQAKRIIELIRQSQQENPDGTIAILVRTRSHLQAIIPALKTAKLAYRAIKIDPLSLRPMIQDLMALTRALIHPADRIAWLSILRAPWCGLSLNDLLKLTGEDQNIPLWQRLQSNEIVNSLSDDGQKRLARILPILKEKILERRRLSLKLWVESTWITLGGPACAEQLSDLEDAAAYFNLLERLDNGSDLIHFDTLIETVKQLFAAPDNQADEKLQIMTIHNAKGLEFDTVILPHLERKPSQDSKQLLLWMERSREENDSDLIIAPVNAIGEEHDRVYNYIKRQQKIKSQHEDGRLLYVAATRAKRQLHLLFSLEHNTNKDISEIKPTANSLLDKLWPAVKEQVICSCLSSRAASSAGPSALGKSLGPALEAARDDKQKHCAGMTETYQTEFSLKRLVSDWKNPIQSLTTTTLFHNKSAGFLLPENKYKIIGTFLHRILQQFSQHGFAWWQQKNTKQQQEYILNHLIQDGILKHQIEDAVSRVNSAIENIFQDPKAHWILESHIESHSELALTSVIDNEIVSLVLDRTFIDNTGTRWIIDYKTSIFSDNDLEKFLVQEKNKYEKQLWLYHQAMQKLSSHPIRVGLYFPMIPAWKEWSFEK